MTGRGAPSRDQRRALRALVWKRSDFRESSRLITLITRRFGKVVTIGKGAHRATSQCLGRVDFLNLVEVKISGARLPMLHRVKLLHEPRRLREPHRYRAANYLSEIFDVAFPPGRPDPGLFDLLSGGLLLIERSPIDAIPQILAGLELRFLGELGVLPPLLACSRCGKRGPLYPTRRHPGLLCREHADTRRAAPDAVLHWLDDVGRRAGKTWGGLDPAPVGTEPLLGSWIAAAIERQPRQRAAAFRV